MGLFILAAILGIIGLGVAVFSSDFKAMGAIALAIGVILFVFSLFVTVPAGHVGVLTTFGKVSENILTEGLHTKAPWSNCHNMSIQQQVQRHAMNASTITGVTVDLEVEVVYQLQPEFAAEMYRTVGKDYYMVRVAPLVNPAFKDILVEYNAEALYTFERPLANARITNALHDSLSHLGITLLRAPISDMYPPQPLIDAINARQVAEQDVLRLEQELVQEEIEADRKRVEAAGIRDFQEIVAEGLTDNYLTWHYSETIREGMNSPNNSTMFLPFNILNLLN